MTSIIKADSFSSRKDEFKDTLSEVVVFGELFDDEEMEMRFHVYRGSDLGEGSIIQGHMNRDIGGIHGKSFMCVGGCGSIDLDRFQGNRILEESVVNCTTENFFLSM